VTSGILSHLNSSQQEAVVFDKGPLLVLAGPGSGKTRVLTYKTAWLIEKGLAPENILLLTFTNKAAEEMKKRIQKLTRKVPPLSGTFHSFCARVLRREGRAIGIPPSFLIYDEEDRRETIKTAIKEIDVSPHSFKPSMVLNLISQAKNELISALEYPNYVQGSFQITVARIYLTYQRLLKEYNALDFDDLLLETVRLFQKEPKILEKYQQQFEYILIDEYQDTNQAQYVLTQLLARKKRKLCVVGDASQAIYGFRGANYRNLLNLKNDFPELKIINLEQNYRSTQIILDAAWEVIRRNTSHPVLKMKTEKNHGQPVFIFCAKNQEEEALFVLKKIIESGRSYKDFAVLYRTNAQSRVIEEVFLRAGIPYILVGGIRFYERREIKDCLSYLRLIINPDDKISLKRVGKLGKNRLEKFKKLRKKIKDKNFSTLEILDKILKTTGYLERFDPKDNEDSVRLENIKELRSVASVFPKLEDFLENVALLTAEYLPANPGKVNGEFGAITLMTAHAAKGTEFPVVFMIGMEEGLFPHLRSLTDKESIEEERRLCYVGMTRAKEELYLTYTRRRLYFGQNLVNQPSRFILDIPPYLCKDLTNDY
jgi:DNA helicase-2/ATP-dependent DNA helicase PcrA